MEKAEKGKEGLKMIGKVGDMRIWDKEKKEKGGKLEEKKEHMAKKMNLGDKMHKMLNDPKHLKNVAIGKAKEAYEKKHSVLD